MRKICLLSLILLLFLAGCNSFGLSQEDQYVTAVVLARTAMAETAAAIPTDTPLPTHTATVTSTATITPTATEAFTATPTVAPTTDTQNSLAYFFIRVDDPEAKGCSYTPVALYIGTLRSGDPLTDITVALNALFAIRTSGSALINQLADSDLEVGSVKMTSDNSVAVNITGNLVRPPKGCGWTYMLDQIQYTARHAAKGYYVGFTYNGLPLKDFLFTGA